MSDVHKVVIINSFILCMKYLYENNATMWKGLLVVTNQQLIPQFR